MNKFIITNKDWGIYLGSFMGLGFWSKLDPAGQPYACVFNSEEEANEYINTWDSRPDTAIILVKVNVNNKDYATIEECVKAGQEGWRVDNFDKNLH